MNTNGTGVMMKLVHLSDLHFGTEHSNLLTPLLNKVNDLSPDMIIISGDFTQRAKAFQFQAARHFINKLNCKDILCVPGNHDIPLHNLLSRMLYPFKKYQKYISPDLNPSYQNNEIVILGINSATPFKIMDGHVSQTQLSLMLDFFNHEKRTSQIKAIFMHHNMIQPQLHKVLINLDEVLHCLADCGVKLILSGHLHDAFIEKIERPYIKYNMYVITAGTALSKRLRTQPQSFNVMLIDHDYFTTCVYAAKDHDFIPGGESKFLF